MGQAIGEEVDEHNGKLLTILFVVYYAQYYVQKPRFLYWQTKTTQNISRLFIPYHPKVWVHL